MIRILAFFLALGSAAAFGQVDRPTTSSQAVDRAAAFLGREVPRWSAENKCYSCHNNGDAARALYTAVRLGVHPYGEALADTTRWLSQPDRWQHNGGDDAFNDKKLATIQFSFALLCAMEADLVQEKTALLRAAEMVAALQEADGSWRIDAAGTVGSPVTYGNCLATAVSRQILNAADTERFRGQVDRAANWLCTHQPKTVLDAAGTLIGLRSVEEPAAVRQRQRCLELIEKAQHESGGWGPFVVSAAEAFDTAIVLLALSDLGPQVVPRKMIQQGRRYLIDQQLDDGSWLETTRPAGAESYAQRLSTAGWATLALLAATPAQTHDASGSPRE
jgi:hypothetical protein